jgi:hypothetical protein
MQTFSRIRMMFHVDKMEIDLQKFLCRSFYFHRVRYFEIVTAFKTSRLVKLIGGRLNKGYWVRVL